mgnify:CR=1 FL=1
MLPVLDKRLFHSLGDCSNRTSNGETSLYQWMLYEDSMEIVEWINIEKIFDFIAYAFLNTEGELFLSKTGGIMPLDSNRYFKREDCEKFYKACTINPDKRYGMRSKFSWFKITGYDSEIVLPTADFDLTKPNLIPLSFAFEKKDYRCKNYLFFLELSKGVHSYSDEKSQFFDYPISDVLTKSYHKTSDFVWLNKKIHRKEDVVAMDCYAYSKDDFDGIELTCILPRDHKDPMDSGARWALFENKDKVYEKSVTGGTPDVHVVDELYNQYPADVILETIREKKNLFIPTTFSKEENDKIIAEKNTPYERFEQMYHLTPDEVFKVDVLGTEMNAKMLNMDNPSYIPNIANEWTKAQGKEYECDEDDSSLVSESFTLPDNYIPEITCVKENKQVIKSLLEVLDLASEEMFDTVLIDNSKKILNKQKDVDLESSELALIQKKNPNIIIILSYHIKYPFSVILDKYKYNDFCVIRNDYKYNDIGELFKKNYCYAHFFSKDLIPNHFGNAIIDYEKLALILSDMIFGEKYLIINNQVLSELIYNKYKIQLYTSEEYIDRISDGSNKEDTKLIVGRNGQRQFFE